MSAPLFSLRPEYRHWDNYLNRTRWGAGNLDSLIEQACHQAYSWSIPVRVCIRDIRACVTDELACDVSVLHVLGFYRRATRNLVTEKCVYFGIITREGHDERH